ncbi:MAG TPA: hypothetical protein VI197_05320, partial [Polyangiaceae bacterium]
KEGGSKLCDFGNYEDGAAGSPPDLAADVYGLGLVLFEMVAGRSALAISRARRQLRGRRAAGPPPLAEVVPGVAGAVSEIVARLLSPDPNDRPTLAALIAEIGGLQCRYEGQVSTTQETAHYATRRMSCVVDPAPPESEVGIIVPLPSQTLEGIPWTVITAALADRPGFGGAPPTVALGAGADVPASLERALVLSSPPGLAKAVLRSLPPRSSPPLGLKVRLLVVMACALLTGFLVAFLARRSEADEAGEAAPGAAATQRLRAGSRGVAAPACRVVSTR